MFPCSECFCTFTSRRAIAAHTLSHRRRQPAASARPDSLLVSDADYFDYNAGIETTTAACSSTQQLPSPLCDGYPSGNSGGEDDTDGEESSTSEGDDLEEEVVIDQSSSQDEEDCEEQPAGTQRCRKSTSCIFSCTH